MGLILGIILLLRSQEIDNSLPQYHIYFYILICIEINNRHGLCLLSAESHIF
jgi:hypothetical protein